MHLITSWRNAQQARALTQIPQREQQQTVWSKPNPGKHKCNIDASFSSIHNEVGIGMCVWGDQGHFVAARNIIDTTHG
jgi:hypothetical protein